LILGGLNAAPQFHSGKVVDVCVAGEVVGFFPQRRGMILRLSSLLPIVRRRRVMNCKLGGNIFGELKFRGFPTVTR
jgi:hypothetical protein